MNLVVWGPGGLPVLYVIAGCVDDLYVIVGTYTGGKYVWLIIYLSNLLKVWSICED